MTAQNADIKNFSETDYNALRQKIYSPKFGSTVEVNLLFFSYLKFNIFEIF